MVDNKKRILELKRKNQITNMCKEWMNAGILIVVDDFLEIQETLMLQGKVLKQLDAMDSKNTSIIYQGNKKDIIASFEELIVTNLKDEEKYVFFMRDATKIGGIVLSGNKITENVQFIIKESELFDNGCSIFFCSLNAESGVCLWRGEYDNRFYVW